MATFVLTPSPLSRFNSLAIPTAPQGFFLARPPFTSNLVPAGATQNSNRFRPGTPINSGRFRQAVHTERKEVLQSVVVAIVRACTRFASLVVVLGLLLAVGAGYYTSQHFAINTDINSLIAQNLDWRQRDQQFDRAFDRDATITAVVEAKTPEMATAASDALYAKLKDNKTDFQSMQQLGTGEFFEKNGLLFLPTEEVAKVTGQFESAAPLIEIMAGDPSIRGLTGALGTGLAGGKGGPGTRGKNEPPLNQNAETGQSRPTK